MPDANLSTREREVKQESDWAHKDVWSRRADTFSVEVCRHSVDSELRAGPHRWAVYAYIYPPHPLFDAIDPERGAWQPDLLDIPLHRLPSYWKVWQDAGEITSYQIGADYAHEGDDHYTIAATKYQAGSVFHDADQLFEWLKDRGHNE